MKHTVILLFGLLLTFSVFGQGLEPTAELIKKRYPSDYEATFKKHAIEKWGDDHRMIVYEINKQTDKFANLLVEFAIHDFESSNEFKTSNTAIVSKAIRKWSYDGYESQNMSRFDKLSSFSIEGLIKLHCDWSMVLYEYDKQVKAKSAY